MPDAEGRRFSLRVGAFCAAIFVAIGIHLPFFPLWLAGQGLNDTEIAAIVAAPLFLRLVLSPVLAGAADRLPSLAHASALYALIAALLLLGLTFADGFWPILILAAGAMVFWNVLIPLADAVLIVGVRNHGIDYGRVRLWGSVGFIAANLGAAAVLRGLAGDAILLLLGGACLVGSLVGFLLPRVVAPRGVEPFGVRRALSDPILRRSLVAGGLILAAHAAYYTFGSVYWRGLGFSTGTIGALWAFGVVVEIVLFFSVKHLRGWGARRFLLVGGAGAVVRWLLFPLAATPETAFMSQALHGATFAATHLGVVMAIGSVATPGHTARIQATHQLVAGLLLAVATLGCGPLYRLAPSVAFAGMSCLSAVGIWLAYGLPRGLQPQRAGEGGSMIAPE
jgi:MFS transporter, PPP family, 3-phenylpropionic acid transporter